MTLRTFPEWHAQNCIGLMSGHACPDPEACVDAYSVEVLHATGRMPIVTMTFTDMEGDPVDGECDDDGDLRQLGEDLREAEGDE